MKTIIAGSRTITDYDLVKSLIKESGFIITEVVCGMAKGVDSLGEQYALEHKIPVTYFPPNWEELGPKAGKIRNRCMGDYGEQLILIHDGLSRGSIHMLNYAQQLKLPYFYRNINEHSITEFI